MAVREPMSNYRVYKKEQLKLFSDFVFAGSIYSKIIII
jgi:hypothetical protein